MNLDRMEDNGVYYRDPYQGIHHLDPIHNWISQRIHSLYEINFREELMNLDII